MTQPFLRGIVRIMDRKGTIRGTGFLVKSDGLILTCKHVLDQDFRKQPGLVPPAPRVVFHMDTDQRLYDAEIDVDRWTQLPSDDVAVLRVKGDLPASVSPLALTAAACAERHAFTTLGYPAGHPDGKAGTGEILFPFGCNPSEGPVQLEHAITITRGYSGAPVIEDLSGLVAGMLQTTDAPDALKKGGETAYCIPSEVLLRVCPELEVKQSSLYRGKVFCLGRDREIDELVGCVLKNPPEPVSVLGGPGIGKTTLTRAVLGRGEVVRRFGTRRLFVECEPTKTSDEILAAIAVTGDLPSAPQIKPMVLRYLSEAPTLLVLDNLETPWEADGLAVESLLRELWDCSGTALVVSLRGQQRPAGIRWHGWQPLEPLDEVDSRALFLAIAGDEFANDPHLDDLCAASDGIPLATGLLAYRAQGEPDLEGLWQHWQKQKTAMLKCKDAKHRLTNLELSFELSIKGPRMTDAARRVLAALAMLPQGMAHEDISAVFPENWEAISILRQTGLAFDEDKRLRMVAPLREHVTAHYPAHPDDRSRVIERYLFLILQFADQVGGRGGADAVRRLTPEVHNAETMILLGLRSEDPTQAAHAAVDWEALMRFTGLGTARPLEEALPLFRQVGDVFREANCAKSLGDLALRLSDLARAEERYGEALLLYRQIGSVMGEAHCIRSFGDMALWRWDYAGARELYDAALTLYRQIRSVHGEANCIRSLGDIALRRLDLAEAQERYEAALPLYRHIGDEFGEAHCMRSLGDLALRRSDLAEAQRRYEATLPLFRQIGDVRGEASCMVGLGDIARERSEREVAQERYEGALPLFRQIGSVLGQANCIQGLGDIALARSDYGTARERYEAALPLFRQVGSILSEANCIQSLGDIALERLDHPGARSRYEEALALYKRIPEPYSIGWAHVRLAQLADDPSARARHVELARQAWESIDRPDLVATLEEFESGAEDESE